MGNSMPTEESGAPSVPEQSGTPMVPEESGAPNVPEQSGTPMVPEESGTTSVPEGAGVSTVQDVGTASVPEGAGVAVGQERSESEADSVLGNSPSYADHVQGPATPPSIPSLGPERFSPSPKEAAQPAEGFASGSIQPETADDEAWGKWTAPPVVPDVPSAPAAQPVALEDREPKRPRRGLPAGVRVELSPVPVPGEAEDRLLRELFRQEQERRIEEAVALGIHLRPGEGEPRPLLSHYFGRPAAVEDMYDSLSQALTIRDRSFLTRVSLVQGASSRYLPGGSSSVYGLNRLERPEEMMAPTPFHPKLPAYPEPEPRPKLMVDASTITDNAADQWSEWLRSARQGRSLREWGILPEDLVMAIKYLSEAHPVVTKGGRWSNAGRRKGQLPNVLGMLGYLKDALRCVDNFDKAPSGYRGLIYGLSALVFERPASSTQADEAESWEYITASMAVRVQRLVDAKRRKARYANFVKHLESASALSASRC